MAIYAVGDIQGCLTPLQQLLERLRFDPATDRLWLVGDLVNRGPHSLETLRLVRSLGKAATCVLGNHDLHLLAVAASGRALKPGDTLRPVVEAPDAGELLDWLRNRPLLHHDSALGWTMVHAGLPPQWDLPLALACATEVETVLRGPYSGELFAAMYGDEPALWTSELHGMERLRYTLNALTRIRYVEPAGTLDFVCKSSPEQAPAGLTPWFRIDGRLSREARVVFGHWSTLGLICEPNVLGLDTGCLWGGRLSAARLDLPGTPVESIHCPQRRHP